MGSFMRFTRHQILFGWQIREK